jgi:valyl-tRNA synthetase
MDLRPQAHEIIRTWLFYTVIRSHIEHGRLPWTDAAISGFVFDPDRKKLSKSAGNAPDDPFALIAEHGSDAVRYWAAGGRPGMDIALDRNQFKIGRRLAIKLLNASKFALGLGEPSPGAAVTEPLDLAMLERLGSVVDEATASFEAYDYTKALERTESFFWSFCDDYLELVKPRAYGSADADAAASAQAALRLALSTLLRLFAPFLPFVTEEVWSWWQEGSIHRSSWPDRAELPPAGADPALLDIAAAVLGEVRKEKTANRRSLRAEVDAVVVRGTAEQLAALAATERDLRDAGRIAVIETAEADALEVEVRLASA